MTGSASGVARDSVGPEGALQPPPDPPLAYVIVLNWNGRGHLDACLGSLVVGSRPNTRVLLVDNGSRDGSVAFVRERYPQVELLPLEENRGFCGGNNAGVAHALARGARWIVLLNNDTRVEPESLERLLAAGEADPEAGVLGGTIRMFDHPEALNSTGVDLNLWGYGRDRDFAAPADAAPRPPGDVLAVSGCFLAVRREVLEEIGFLDERFFAYYEDVDFCLRVWDRTAYRVRYVPDAVIYHKVSASTSGASKYRNLLQRKNQLRVLARHYPLPFLLRETGPMVWHRAGVVARARVALDPATSWVELWYLLRFVWALPLVALGRAGAALLGRRARRERFWPLLLRQRGVPQGKVIPQDYALTAPDAAQAAALGPLPARLVMGVNDGVLGPGWSPVTQGVPRARWLRSGRGLCHLATPDGAGVLQVHAFAQPSALPAALCVSLEGTGAARTPLRAGWTTYTFALPSPLAAGPRTVALCAQGPCGRSLPDALGVNEVALLSGGSPLLRVTGKI